VLTRQRRPRADRERGAVLLIMALCLTALMGVAAFAVDLGYDRQQTRHQQAGSDAGALAGALELPESTTADAAKAATARAMAAQFAIESLFDGTSPAVPAGSCSANTCTYAVQGLTLTVTTPYTPPDGLPSLYHSHNFIHVRACQPGADWFRAFLGDGERTLCREAVARRRNIYANLARGLIALDQSQCAAMQFGGSSDTDLHSDGAVVVESSCPTNALDGGGSAWDVTAGLITVVGEADITPCSIGPAGCVHAPAPVEGVMRQGDPLADLPAPAVPSVAPSPTSGGTNPIAGGPACDHTYQPGRYLGELQVNNNQTACFAPGLYYLDDGFTSNGNAELYGTGVFFYVAGGAVQLNGTGRLELEPVSNAVAATDPLYPWRGISIFQSRTNTSAAHINGNDESSIGTIYLPAAHLDFQGNAGDAGDDFVTGMVVADTVRITGNGNLTIDAEEPEQAEPAEPDLGLHR
jgi:hypothetical protein